MPIYEYRCKDCGHHLEAQQSFTDEPLTECPSCGGTLKKKFSAVGISFKGSGFYKTDSRGSSTSSSGTSSDSKPSSDTASSTGSSSSSSSSSSSGGNGSDAKATSASSAAPASTPAAG